MKFTYLLIDFFTVLVPFLFSFHPRIKFYKHWAALFPAMIITGVGFITWDMYFTSLKIWGFNADYLTGIYVGNLPIEEVLFFLCVPYACVFTYCALSVIIKSTMSKSVQAAVSVLLIALSVFLAIRFYGHSYTCYTFVLLASTLLTAQFILKARWLSRFYITYLVILLPFFIVNGLLTGTGLQAPVVWYNPVQIINLRILTIPVEDIFYGMDLILINIMIYFLISAALFKTRKSRKRAQTNYSKYANTKIIS